MTGIETGVGGVESGAKAVKLARTLMYVHVGAAVVFIVLGVLAAGGDDAADAADAATEDPTALQAVAGLLGLFGLLALVGFLIAAPGLKKHKEGARKIAVFGAAYLVVSGVVGVAANPTPVGAAFAALFIALDGLVIMNLNKPAVRAAFAAGGGSDQGSGAGGGGRLDPSGLPKL